MYVYILFTRRIETFWFRDLSNTRDIRTYSSKYFQFVPKSEKKKILTIHKDF